jgi:hypothetical protein
LYFAIFIYTELGLKVGYLGIPTLKKTNGTTGKNSTRIKSKPNANAIGFDFILVELIYKKC